MQRGNPYRLPILGALAAAAATAFSLLLWPGGLSQAGPSDAVAGRVSGQGGSSVVATPTPPAVDVEVRAFPVVGADPWLLAPNPSSLGVAFTAYQANRVGVLTYGVPAASVVQFELPIPGAGPWDVTWFGQQLWFTEEGANKVASLDPASGVLREYDIPTPDSMPRGIDGLEYIWFTEFQGQKVGRIDPTNDFLMTEYWPDPGCTTLNGPLDIRETGPVWFTDSGGDRIVMLWREFPSGIWYFDFWNVPTPPSTPWGLDVPLPLPRVVWFAETRGLPPQVARLDPTSPDARCQAQFRDFVSLTSDTLIRQESESFPNEYRQRAGFVARSALQTADFIEYNIPGSVAAPPGPSYLDVMENPPDAENGQLFVGSVWFTEPGRSPRAVGLLLPSTSPPQGQLAKIEPLIIEVWGLAIQDRGSPGVWFAAPQQPDGIIGLILPLGIVLPAPTATPTPTATPSPTVVPTLVPPDTDGDGCSDSEEMGSNEFLGGRRDPLNPWDFYDVPLPVGAPGTGTRDTQIDLGDVLAVIAKFGSHPTNPPGAPLYDIAYDRGEPTPDPWDTQEPTGPDVGVTLADVFWDIAQFGHSCFPPP